MPGDRRMSKHTKSGAHLLYDEILSGIIELKVNKNKSVSIDSSSYKGTSQHNCMQRTTVNVSHELPAERALCQYQQQI